MVCSAIRAPPFFGSVPSPASFLSNPSRQRTAHEVSSVRRCVVKVLILGASGLLGHVVHRVLHRAASLAVCGTRRSTNSSDGETLQYVAVADLTDPRELHSLLERTRPEVVINALAPARGVLRSGEPKPLLATLAQVPVWLGRWAGSDGARIVHISSDGVFSGTRGAYTEADWPDASDTYGVAKQLGESAGPGVLNLRTSFLGPEIGETRSGLLEWLLKQKGTVQGHTDSIFSGLPSIVLAEVLRDVVLPDPGLTGTYHLAASAISKHDLLVLAARRYELDVTIEPSPGPRIDRSLDATAFAERTGFVAPAWPDLIELMYNDHLRHGFVPRADSPARPA